MPKTDLDLYAEVDEDDDPLAVSVRPKSNYGVCSGCLERHRISMDGTVRNHSDPRAGKWGHCPGGHRRPLAKGALDGQKADALNAAWTTREREIDQAHAILDAARRQYDSSCEAADRTYRLQAEGIEHRFADVATRLGTVTDRA